MPAIRKKTSNRGTTNKRARIQGKAAESRKKQKRAGKNVVQWKSKHKKDPGIPNNFPYKDQILAEVAEERRQVIEEKQRRKDEKKASKTGATIEDVSDAEGEAEAEAEPIVFDGVGGISGKATAREKGKGKSLVEDVEMEDGEDVPILINHDLLNLQSVLDQADVILQVLDARDPLAFRSAHLDELAAAKPGTKTLLVLNKIDTIPRESVASWLAYLRTQHPTLLFRASSAFLPTASEVLVKPKGKGKFSTTDATGAKSVLACLSQWAREKEGDKPLAVAVVGLTNAGKSSFVNSLLGKATLPIYTLSSSSLDPTTTSLPQEVTLEASGKQIRLIDTPGLSWVASSEETPEEHDAFRARDILLRNKGRIDRLKDPKFALAHIISRADTEDLMLLYNLPAFPKGDPNAFLAGISRSNGMVKKAGVLDLAGAARTVLRDWSVGRFPRFTPTPAVPDTSSPAPAAAVLAELYSKDEQMLASLKTRREIRKSTGLVKLVAGSIESRRADVEGSWAGVKQTEDASEDEDEGEGDEAADEDDSGSDDDDGEEAEDVEMEDLEDESSEEEEEPVLVPAGKRKRAGKITGPAARPSKKVAFAPDPKESKQARSAAGAAKKAIVAAPKPKSKPTLKPKPTAVPTKVKAANVGHGKKSAVKTSPSKSGEEAYDFGKFF